MCVSSPVLMTGEQVLLSLDKHLLLPFGYRSLRPVDSEGLAYVGFRSTHQVLM